MDQHCSFDYTPAQNGQNEVLFENTHIRDKAFWKEFYTYAFFKRKIMVVIYILMALTFVANLIPFLTNGDGSLIGLLLPPLYVLFVIFLILRSTKLANKRETENGNGNPIVYTTEITNDTLIMHTTKGARHELSLSTVKRIVQTKKYLMLQTPAAQLYPIKKDGFTKGTYEALCAHLRAKGLKVKTK